MLYSKISAFRIEDFTEVIRDCNMPQLIYVIIIITLIGNDYNYKFSEFHVIE